MTFDLALEDGKKDNGSNEERGGGSWGCGLCCEGGVCGVGGLLAPSIAP